MPAELSFHRLFLPPLPFPFLFLPERPFALSHLLFPSPFQSKCVHSIPFPRCLASLTPFVSSSLWCARVSSANKQRFAPLRNAGCTIHRQCGVVGAAPSPLATFCRLVQHTESHEDAGMLHHVCSAATQLKLKEFLSNLDSLSQSILPNIAADLMAAFSEAPAELRVNFARVQDSQCSRAGSALHGPPVGCAG